jgi:hypothetical protein
MDKGFIYYAWFPVINVFKVGRTIQGLRRFSNSDYRRFYKQYNGSNIYAWTHMIEIENHKWIEKELHRIYKSCDFENIGTKNEFYYAEDIYQYRLSKSIFDEVRVLKKEY